MNSAEKKQNTSKRANKILDIAMNMAQDKVWQVKSAIENIQLHYDGYAEPGYDVGEAGIVATGNWNEVTGYNHTTRQVETISDLPNRILNLFEKMGIECEWSDEWATCSCGKLIRTQPDSYGWTRSYSVYDGEYACIECLKEDPEGYLGNLEDNPDMANTIKDIDPADYGYIKVNEDSYASGWHPGQNADPHKVAKELRAKGISRFLFHIDDVGQFDTHWSVYVHSEEEHLLNPAEEDPCESCSNDCDGCDHDALVAVVIEQPKKEVPCKFCKTSLWEDETPCWKCGTDNPTR